MTRAVLPYPRTHPSYQPTTDEAIADVKAVTLAELKRLPPMFGTSDATLTLVGDLDAAAVTPWITQTWGAWKSPRPFRRIPRRYVATAGAEQVLDFPDKANALILAAAAIPMRDDDPDAAAMEVADYTLGGGGFVSRLMTRLRQQDGLSYGAFSGWAPSSLDVAAFLYAGAEVNPQNARRGLAAMMEEVTRFAAHGITAAELKGAKDGLRAAFERDLADDDNVLGLLHTGLYLGRTLAFEADRQAAIAGLTTAQVNQVIQRRIDPSKLVRITAGDRAKF
jgi:zinc protease